MLAIKNIAFTFAFLKKERDCASTDAPEKVIKKQQSDTVRGEVPILDSILQPLVNSISPEIKPVDIFKLLFPSLAKIGLIR